MKKFWYKGLAGIGILSLIFLVSSAGAQSGRRLHYSTLFNPATVSTLSGEVVRVEHAFSGSGADYCVHALLKTPEGQVTAILAPKGYMTEQGFAIAPKDRVTVRGSRISILNKPFLLVTEVSGDCTMTLRAADGRPVWAVGDDWHVH
uniref:Magnetosome protein MamS/MamX domain-containing protein n=1 Tax=Desulfobacca acetoxidans TaxID=60893 RepID=A0A7V4G7L3_9BACT